jgi:hypothetical protein
MINEPINLDNGRELLDYNTDRPPLILPEYGRSIQNMVDYCMTLDDRKERNRCARTIVQIMSSLRPHSGDETEYQKKLWNHLAAISRYELDVDYPYEIEKMSDQSNERERIEYPQQNISKRHYGAIIESLLKKLPEISDKKEREALIRMVANQMKRSLGRWNKDAMTEEKVLDDLARMTDGAARYLPGELHLLSDNEILTDVQQMRPSKKKKKK